MLKIYYRRGCNSSRRALFWIEKYKLDKQKIPVNKLSRNDLIKLLQYSDEGLKDIVKRPARSSVKVTKALEYVESLTFNEAIDYILSHPYIIQTPIILQNKNHLIGYNEYEIRKFIPKHYRKASFASSKQEYLKGEIITG